MMLSNPDRSPIGLTTRSPSHCARGGVAYTCCVRGSSPCLSLPEGLAHGRKPWALFGQDFRPDFDIQVQQQDRGVRLDLFNAPAQAFVDGQIIRGVAELLNAVVRDLIYTAIELAPEYASELGTCFRHTSHVCAACGPTICAACCTGRYF